MFYIVGKPATSIEMSCIMEAAISPPSLLFSWAATSCRQFHSMQTILNSYLHYPTNYYCIVGLRVASCSVTSEAGTRLPTHQHSWIRIRVLFWNPYQLQLIPHPLQEAIPKAPTELTQVAQPLPSLNNPEATIYHTMFIMEPRVICAQ